jgi:hypothetical protein
MRIRPHLTGLQIGPEIAHLLFWVEVRQYSWFRGVVLWDSSVLIEMWLGTVMGEKSTVPGQPAGSDIKSIVERYKS